MFVIVQALDNFKGSASYHPPLKNNYLDVDEHEDKDEELNPGNINLVSTVSGNSL